MAATQAITGNEANICELIDALNNESNTSTSTEASTASSTASSTTTSTGVEIVNLCNKSIDKNPSFMYNKDNKMKGGLFKNESQSGIYVT